MCMPYQFFNDDLKWKIELEEEKRKRIEDQNKSSKDKSTKALKSKQRGGR